MFCKICMKKTAQFHTPKIINNEIVYIHLCRDCAEQKKSHEIANGFDDKLHFLLEGLLRSKENEKGSSSQSVCNTCGTTLKNLKKNKLLGCPRCYEIFSEYLLKDLNSIDTVFTKHSINNEITEQIDRMKKELRVAVEIENFEKAALLRDKIRKCEKEGSFLEN